MKKVLVVDDQSVGAEEQLRIEKAIYARNCVTMSKNRPTVAPKRTFPSMQEVASALNDPSSGLERVEGRTLPKGYQWDGKEVPGRGKAAARRLRQLERQKEK